MIANGGLRYDAMGFVRPTPRLALIGALVHPVDEYLYGRAFRAPNQYELNSFYFGEATRNLRPESIDTHEIVWERYINDWLRTSVATYWLQGRPPITLTADPID